MVQIVAVVALITLLWLFRDLLSSGSSEQKGRLAK